MNFEVESIKFSEPKQIKFFDKQVLQYLFGSEQQWSESELQNFGLIENTWVLILAENKIYFYDYLSDQAEELSSLQFEFKQLKVFEIINEQYLAVGCSDGSLKIIDLIKKMCVKTMKGYHSKAITSIIAYKQNQQDRPRIIVNSQDGLLACWNVDTNVETPAFKFLMNKKGK